MATDVIPTPNRSYRTRRTVLVAALALVVAALIGAGVVAMTRSDESATRAPTVQRAAPLLTEDVESCPGDGGALLVTMASMPIDVSSDIMGRLSAPTRALVASAVEQSVITRTTPGPPDAATLSAVLARVGSADAGLVMSGLSSQTRDLIAAQPRGSACS